MGPSGAGKTTLCSLIPRFYEVSEGAISIDGIDIRDMKLNGLRNHVGIVQQDVYLFAGTVMDNIRYGRPDASDEDVVRAAKRANAHEFIMNLPEEYHTDIGQRGVKLSGGQKQRLSIARVFLKNPQILIWLKAGRRSSSPTGLARYAMPAGYWCLQKRGSQNREPTKS